MASKAKPTAKEKEKEKDEAPEKELPEAPDAPLPLLDLSDAAINKLIRIVKKRGYVTHDQINSVLPSEKVNSEQIEDILAMFSEMGVNVVETEEASDDEEHGRNPRKRPRPRAASWSRFRARSRRRWIPRNRSTAPTILCGCICARWARWSCSRARAKSRSQNASKRVARL